MSMQIIGDVDKNRIYCGGSFTKFVTTFVCLSLLAEKHDLARILDDDDFLDSISTAPAARSFLDIFQKQIGSRFTIRDVCTYYTGLPYTFDVSAAELERVDQGQAYKHHSILDEKTFLDYCQHEITQIYPNRSKFHYSEVAIIFIGYLMEKIHSVKMENLYQTFVIK